MDKVKGVHPSLRQHVVTMGGDAYTFKRIAEFGLYSAHANPDIYCGWEDWENEQNNDGVTIVDRSMCKQLNYRSDESEYYSHNWTEFFYDDIDGYYSDEYDDLAYRYGGLGF
ncbi:Exonuclease mut-7 [Phytophthora boehmeriae]|uniref:Exonuclease mut-7 n=1 Tax=Phytophthora boehmeriae TaxID=109152 RepID=A0A8T1X5S2_9STRA|nr:Exonuclease mut-7 [Phytophthora boehmeriae]